MDIGLGVVERGRLEIEIEIVIEGEKVIEMDVEKSVFFIK